MSAASIKRTLERLAMAPGTYGNALLGAGKYGGLKITRKCLKGPQYRYEEGNKEGKKPGKCKKFRYNVAALSPTQIMRFYEKLQAKKSKKKPAPAADNQVAAALLGAAMMGAGKGGCMFPSAARGGKKRASPAQKAAAKRSPWLSFLKEFRAEHPEMRSDQKTLLRMASQAYHAMGY